MIFLCSDWNRVDQAGSTSPSTCSYIHNLQVKNKLDINTKDTKHANKFVVEVEKLLFIDTEMIHLTDCYQLDAAGQTMLRCVFVTLFNIDCSLLLLSTSTRFHSSALVMPMANLITVTINIGAHSCCVCVETRMLTGALLPPLTSSAVFLPRP